MVASVSCRSWSIPACAGEPLYLRSDPIAAEVYPRVCGGTLECRAHRIACQGLSPRVRGNQEDPLCPRPPARSIPACAGEPA